jgi:hypothetical protein
MLLLEAGQEILREEGVQTGSVNLTFKRVFERVEAQTGLHVTNASVIKRIWENQADFQTDVLVAVAHDESRPEINRTIAALGPLLEQADLSTEGSRARLVQQVCRVGGEANATAIAESTNYSLWMNVVATATSSGPPEQRERILQALRQGYATVGKFWEETFAGLAGIVGLQLRAPWTGSQFVMALTALNEGFSIRHRINGHLERVSRPTGPNSEEQEWTLFAVGLEALVHQFFEPDPVGLQ